MTVCSSHNFVLFVWLERKNESFWLNESVVIYTVHL